VTLNSTEIQVHLLMCSYCCNMMGPYFDPWGTLHHAWLRSHIQRDSDEQEEEQQSVDHSQSNRIHQSHSIPHFCCHGNSHCCYIGHHVHRKSFTCVLHSSSLRGRYVFKSGRWGVELKSVVELNPQMRSAGDLTALSLQTFASRGNLEWCGEILVPLVSG